MPANELPDVTISEEKLNEINLWLDQQIRDALLAREDLEQSWLEIYEWYEKTELETKKDFPFKGAAHIMIQLMPTYCERIKAKLINSLFMPKDPFAVSPSRKEFNELVKPLRDFCTWASTFDLDLEEQFDTILSEETKLGNAVVKIVYLQEDETFFEYNEEIEQFEEVTKRTQDGVEVIPIALPDHLFPMESRKYDKVAWEGHRVRLTWNEVLERIASGLYDKEAEDVLRSWEENQKTRFEEGRHEQVDIPIQDLVEFEVWEIWFKFLLKDTDKVPTKLVWSFHLDSKTALRKQYNWYPLGLNPYEMIAFEPREHKIYATGVGRMTLPVQKEVSVMHNQRLDSVNLRNSVVFKRKQDSMAPDEISPTQGGVITMEDPEKDLIPMIFGQQYDSTIQDEQHTLGLLQQRIGLEDYFGDDLAGAAATVAMQMRQESTRRFDGHMRRHRKFMQKIMIKALLLYQKYMPEEKPILILGEDGQWIQAVFQFPDVWITEAMGISVTATTSSTSKEQERQGKLSLFGLLTQYYGQLTQYLLQASSEQLPPPVRIAMFHIVNGLTTFVEDILEDFDLHNADELTIALSDLREQAGEARASLATQTNGGAPGLPGVPGAPDQITAGQGAGAPQG